VSENQAEIAELEQRLRLLDAERHALMVRLESLKRSLSQGVEPLGCPAAAQVPTTAEDRVALFLSLFGCRLDVFPRLWENPRKGTKGYAPACRNEWVRGVCQKPQVKCSDCPSQAFLPLDSEVAEIHLRGGSTIGSYAIRADDTCIFLACDFDGQGWQENVLAYQRAGAELGVDVAVERSRSGNGAHAWLFFGEPVPARLARQLGTLLLARTVDRLPLMGFGSFDRFFPNQDFLPKGGFGNLIALPLQRGPRERGNSVFVTPALDPVPDQWEYLAQVRRLSLADVELTIGRFRMPDAVQVHDGAREDSISDARTEDCLLAPGEGDAEPRMTGMPVAIRLGSQLTISLDGLPARLVGRLKRLAAFPNPEFYKLNRLRLPTYPHPRIIFGGELQTDRLLLPRGVLDEATRILNSAGAKVSVVDERQRLRRMRAEFRGALTPDQANAVRSLCKHDFGVFVAPPGTGKTVVACALVAERKTPTLILVHRQPLVEQWRSRLTQFLNVVDEEVGLVSGTKKRTTGKVDIAMLQTLGRASDLGAVLPHYGQVIVDECHHIPALSFEQVLKQLPAKFVLGLTATPYRKDGLQKIIHFQCGPVRHEVRSVGIGEVPRRVVVRETGFRIPEEAGLRAPFHVIWHYLVRDAARTEMIAGDVVRVLLQGRVPLVISDRREHLQSLSEEIQRQGSGMDIMVFRLDGEVPLSARKKMMSELCTALGRKQRTCLVSTASLIGEGFDLPALDTLFMALPISFKGRVVQYAGRLQRPSEGKKDVLVYDYVDSHCAMALKMYRNRLRAYRYMGYSVQEPVEMVGATRESAASQEVERTREFWDRTFKAATQEVRDAPCGRDLSDIVSRLRAAGAVDALDLGCGFGRWSVILARAGFRVLAVDVSSEAVRIVRERAQRKGLAIDTAACAAQELSHLGVRVDAVVCNSVLDHMRPLDAEQAAGSIEQVLRPGGLVYVSFDGLDKSDTCAEVQQDHVVSADGTWDYVTGPRRGMVWRFYQDTEIRRLFREFEEVDFAVTDTGQRRAWFRKPRLGSPGV